ncbi:DsbA family protein [Helcobacillus massiliensis]|uniref:Protein-disulfide isomerase n=1 Tax=Helcobacillus massiliensis TaxID=521392 RepID=A0A839QS94_9MICO|nr:thioredoxin domain-containing protein [Helcobacillus massiliensis]MBB3023363.1 protein-disulfide isomerase [Helcobacillus massiliensis]MDK7742436.1 thioredoxin domain-containing protein [Helcobacillus massiliensis]WOO92477.1 thioredoxin domain-containing protein [Helcobacillus massiliensis]
MSSRASGQATSRDAQRERLRKQRQAELKRQRNIRRAVIAVVTILALLLAGGIGYGIWKATAGKDDPRAKVIETTKLDPKDPALVVGAEPGSAPKVDIVLDFNCPFCGEFEKINGEDLNELAKNGEVTLRYNVRTGLDGASADFYSSRAAGAAVCTYEESPDLFMKFQLELFKNQPEETGPGLTNQQMVKYAKDAGASKETQQCISSNKYQGWASKYAEPAGKDLSRATPAVFINGEEWQGNWTQPGELKKAVQGADAPKE